MAAVRFFKWWRRQMNDICWSIIEMDRVYCKTLHFPNCVVQYLTLVQAHHFHAFEHRHKTSVTVLMIDNGKRIRIEVTEKFGAALYTFLPELFDFGLQQPANWNLLLLPFRP